MLRREALERLKLRPIDVALLDLDDDVVSLWRLRHHVRPIAGDRVRELEVAFDAGPYFVAVVEELQRLEKDDTIMVVTRGRLILGGHRTPLNEAAIVTASDDDRQYRVPLQ